MVEALQECFEEGLEWLGTPRNTSLAAQATVRTVRYDIMQPLFRLWGSVGEGIRSRDTDANII